MESFEVDTKTINRWAFGIGDGEAIIDLKASDTEYSTIMVYATKDLGTIRFAEIIGGDPKWN